MFKCESMFSYTFSVRYDGDKMWGYRVQMAQKLGLVTEVDNCPHTLILSF